MHRTSWTVCIVGTVCVLLIASLPVAADAPQESENDEREVVVLKAVSSGGEPGEEGVHRRMIFHPLSGGYLGVRLTDLTPELRTHFGVPDDRGVLVARVEEGSPAEEAGLAVGDVVTEVDGEPVESTWDLSVAVRRRSEGETVDLEVWRDGRALDFTATVRERERERIEIGGLLEEGRLEHLPRMRWFEGEAGEGDEAIVRLRPRIVEELGESLGRVDWPALHESLQERNRELETRLEELEARLRELEERLEE